MRPSWTDSIPEAISASFRAAASGSENGRALAYFMVGLAPSTPIRLSEGQPENMRTLPPASHDRARLTIQHRLQLPEGGGRPLDRAQREQGDPPQRLHLASIRS